jgi:glutamate-1-semialdehyde aminotransferase
MDPRTTTGVGVARIQELYDLRERLERLRSVSSAGTFSAREAARMSGTGHLEQIAQHTKETARNTRNLKKPTFTAG